MATQPTARTASVNSVTSTVVNNRRTKTAEAYAEIRTYQATTSLPVDRADLDSLRPNRWINNHIINYMVFTLANTYVETRLLLPHEICFVTTLIWSTFVGSGHCRTTFTISNPLRSLFVTIPINVNGNHWILAIVAYSSCNLILPSKMDKAASPPPPLSLFILDSLASATDRDMVEHQLRKLIKAMGKPMAAFLPKKVDTMPIYWPEV